ncbi:glycosyltransferase family 4 protein [Prevotella brevis]|nr:glycosyltransferase family 4 protein [Xylanibacter brevis]
MKILYQHITQNYSGVEKRFYNYYKYLEANPDGNQYTILCTRTFIAKYAQGLKNAVNLKIIPYGLVWKKPCKFARYVDYLCLLFRLLLLNNKKFDVAHAPSTRMFLKYTRSRKKVISAVNSIPYQLVTDINHKATRELICKYHAYVDCLDENIQNIVRQTYPTACDHILKSPCSFVDYSGLPHRGKKEHAVVFAGRFMKEKGIRLLLDQLDNILSKTSYKIYIKGRGPLHDEVKERVNNCICPERVELGFVMNLPELLERTEVFLSLQEFENYPSQSLLEAMYARNAVIATNVGLTEKLIKPCFGILINNGAELLAALKKIETADIEKMTDSAYKFVSENHNAKSFHDYLINLYSL